MKRVIFAAIVLLAVSCGEVTKEVNSADTKIALLYRVEVGMPDNQTVVKYVYAMSDTHAVQVADDATGVGLSKSYKSEVVRPVNKAFRYTIVIEY